MKLKKEMVLFGVILLLCINFISASVTCINNNISLVYNEGEIPGGEIIITSCTSTNSTSINFVGGTNIQKGSDMEIISGTKNLKIQISNSITSGRYYPTFSFGDGSNPVYITLNVEETESESQGCIIDIFPSILSNVKVKQGESKSRNVQLSVPSCYTSPVTVNGIVLQTDERPIQLGEISVGKIQPGSSVMIPLEIDSINDVSTGTYSDLLQFLLYDDLGNKINANSVSISVMVTSGISPITNFSLTDLPTCSLDAIDMAINQTHTLTCSRTNPNIDVEPIIDYNYIKGLSVSETSSQYIYSFEPKIIGVTNVGAKFKDKNAELGSPFLQEIRITPSGSTPAGGITTKFSFYQSGIKKEVSSLISGETIILILDNSTGNILPSFTLRVNGIESNSTINLEADKPYELIASVPSYLDNTVNFTVSKSQLILEVNPSKTFYFIGEEINLSSNINNTSFLLDGYLITSPYIFDKAGTFELKANKEGYESTNTTIVVKNEVSLNWNSCSLNWEKWKKGSSVACSITQNASWEIYLNETLITSGSGTIIEFEINDYGLIEIRADGINIGQVNIEKKGLWNRITGATIGEGRAKITIPIIFILLIIIYFLFFRGRYKEDNEDRSEGYPGGE